LLASITAGICPTLLRPAENLAASSWSLPRSRASSDLQRFS
jgi:hypothetical protein